LSTAVGCVNVTVSGKIPEALSSERKLNSADDPTAPDWHSLVSCWLSTSATACVPAVQPETAKPIASPGRNEPVAFNAG
jgi:hypothetical protein